jgi:hypothetical protein
MPLYSIPRRPWTPPHSEPTPMNWRRGLFRVWVLVSAAWMMSWGIYLVINVVRDGITSRELFVWPILLIGPPVALLIFGLAAGWAFRGFKDVPETAKE